ncbi:MAG: hypothetical protein AB7E32_06155 [Desulfovibrio sp.]
MKLPTILSLLLAVALLATPASAQETATEYAQDYDQDYAHMSPFTPTELNSFLKDWPAFTQWAESRGEELDQTGNEDIWTREAAAFVSSLGWNHERFFYVAHQCAVGISGLAMEEQGPAILAQLAEARQQIMADQTMTPEQKQQMLQMLDQSQGGMSEMQDMQEHVPAQEMALIKSRANDIRRVMQVEQ